MNTREQLAEIIRDGVGMWRTPLEAADAILGALAPRAALDAVLALHKREPLTFAQGANCAECEAEWPCPTVAAVNDALEAGK